MDGPRDEIEAGWEAHDRAGEKIGDIEEVGVTHLVVSRGLVMPSDLYVPLHAVDGVDREAGRVVLAVDAGQVEELGWTERPMPDPIDGGVEGLGYTGRDTDDTAAGDLPDGVEGLGFTGRPVGDDARQPEDAPRH
ncbi:MAG TPA: hypothetical protein VGC90_06550 [Candidatus Limnocylindrales bacterium]|jgi:hypothetical protein